MLTEYETRIARELALTGDRAAVIAKAAQRESAASDRLDSCLEKLRDYLVAKCEGNIRADDRAHIDYADAILKRESVGGPG